MNVNFVDETLKLKRPAVLLTTHTNMQLGFSPLVFSKRQRITLRLLYAMSRPSVVCLSSVCLSVCDVGAPYSGG